MAPNLGVIFTGLHFENPFLLASAPPTESEDHILRAFEAGWGGIVTKRLSGNLSAPLCLYQAASVR